MFHLLLGIIYLAFVSLGLPDSLLRARRGPAYIRVLRPGLLYGRDLHDHCGGHHRLQPAEQPPDRPLWHRAGDRLQRAADGGGSLRLLISRSYLELCLWAVPYGLGAGCVDASLNNYVALHYASRT